MILTIHIIKDNFYGASFFSPSFGGGNLKSPYEVEGEIYLSKSNRVLFSGDTKEECIDNFRQYCKYQLTFKNLTKHHIEDFIEYQVNMKMSREEWIDLLTSERKDNDQLRTKRILTDEPYGEKNINYIWDLLSNEYHRYIALVRHEVSEEFMLSNLYTIPNYKEQCLSDWDTMKQTGKTYKELMHAQTQPHMDDRSYSYC